MLSRSSTVIRSPFVRGLMRTSQQQTQKRAMGGGGAYMQTNQFGARVGEVFGTIAWLWVFYRFSQDGKVLLGYEHPWEHGHHGGGHGHGSHGHKVLSADERAASWEVFANKAINPGDDDDEEEDDDDEEEEDED
ncbi:hypothetical protein IV203_035491 [Nitzschia inconspicua]|uniref:Uncharacterized protein n=1 Tax=Nitzschia inconspicua TaxID=303405 RepID=A0A9K3LDV7_9STRA|nr:hypothetical protein IV203_035491 [Nitzschia inconspicua]